MCISYRRQPHLFQEDAGLFLEGRVAADPEQTFVKHQPLVAGVACGGQPKNLGDLPGFGVQLPEDGAPLVVGQLDPARRRQAPVGKPRS